MTKLVLDRFLPYRLSITSNLVSDRIARIYEALFALSIPEWRLVAVIAEAETITQAEIGERTRMDKVTVSRAAIALVERGLQSRR
jgi:DNA-binding MarR family transcriptional regulator